MLGLREAALVLGSTMQHLRVIVEDKEEVQGVRTGESWQKWAGAELKDQVGPGQVGAGRRWGRGRAGTEPGRGRTGWVEEASVGPKGQGSQETTLSGARLL